MLSQSKRKVSLFTAMSLFCAMVELVIPKPGFVRIGLSNIPVMLALYCSFSPAEYWALVGLRLVMQAMLNGTLFSYAFILSVSAGLSSAFTMFFAYRFFLVKKISFNLFGHTFGMSEIPEVSFVALSEAGAFVSNAVQIYVSHFFLGDGVYSLIPIIMGCGLVTSFALGIFTSKFCASSDFLKAIKDVSFFAAFLPASKTMSFRIKLDRIVKVILSCAVLFVGFFADNAIISGSVCFAFLCACLISKRHLRLWPVLWTIMRTVLITVIVPSGKILFSVGVLKITQDSVMLGLHRSFIILSSCWFSRFIIPGAKELDTAFRPGSLVYLTLDHFKEITEQWYKTDKKLKLSEKVDKTLLNAVKNCSNLA